MDKDSWVAENIFAKRNTSVTSERKLRRNVEKVNYYTATRKTKINICVLPSWAVYMPPYNLARLAGLIREIGFDLKIFDFNVDAYHHLSKNVDSLKEAWASANFWWWLNESEYQTRILPHYQPMLEQHLEKMLENNPDIVGFSLYYTNKWATYWMIDQIKKRRPDITIILGGPECAEVSFKKPAVCDYYFVGESEQNIVDFLNNWENGIKPDNDKIGGLYSDIRIDIDSLPYPDYHDYDLSKYIASNSVCSEISRGCVARCTYCSEVWYWKFRDRGSKTVVDEIEYMVNEYGIDYVNFVDSLMNGNLKEFRKFCEELVKRDLKIGWWGYMRADGRMDLDFYKTIKAAGASGFNYGFESGSNKVLAGINKKNTVEEIDQNILDSAQVDLKVNACLVIGAPEEDAEAFMHTCTLLWRHRKRILAVSPGPGLGDNLGSSYDDRERFGINPRSESWLNGWYRLDRTNTKLHRFIRVKLMHIWINMCRTLGDGTLINGHAQEGNIEDHYSINSFDGHFIGDQLLNEQFDCQVIKSDDLSKFALTLINEPFSLLRLLWRARGGFEITIDLSDELNKRDFNFVFNSKSDTSYDSYVYFKIDNDGNYSYKVSATFKNRQTQHFDEKDFDVQFEDTGKWIESSAIKQKKKIFMMASEQKKTLPISSAFAGIAVSARKELFNIGQKLKENSYVLDLNSDFGARAAIFAASNQYSNIICATNKFNPKQMISSWPWLKEQVIQVAHERHSNNAEKKALEFVDLINAKVDEDVFGNSAHNSIISEYRNIKTYELNELETASMLNFRNFEFSLTNKCNVIICNVFNKDEATHYYESLVESCIADNGFLIFPCGNIVEVSQFCEELIKTEEWQLFKIIDSLTILKKVK